jgi:hypothetical protein
MDARNGGNPFDDVRMPIPAFTPTGVGGDRPWVGGQRPQPSRPAPSDEIGPDFVFRSRDHRRLTPKWAPSADFGASLLVLFRMVLNDRQNTGTVSLELGDADAWELREFVQVSRFAERDFP